METDVESIEKKSFKKRILIVLFSIFSVCAALVIFLSTSTAFADDGEGTGTDTDADELAVYGYEMEDVFQILAMQDEQLSKITKIIAPGSLAAKLYGGADEDGNASETIADSLLYNDDSPAHKGIAIMSVFGMLGLMIYGLQQIVKLAKDDKGSVESWLQLAIILVLGILALSYVEPILDGIDKGGTLLWSGIQKTIAGDFNEEAYHEAYQEAWIATSETASSASGSQVYSSSQPINGAAFLQLFPFIRTLGLRLRAEFIGGTFRILMYFTYYSILVSVYGLLFEMVIRRMFTPIAITGIAVEGIRSPGVRYLKNYFALYIRLAMFVVIISLSCRASSWALSAGKGFKMTMFGDGRILPHDAWSGINTGLSLGGNIITNATLRPMLNIILTITCIRAATKALMNSTANIAREVVGGN